MSAFSTGALVLSALIHYGLMHVIHPSGRMTQCKDQTRALSCGLLAYVCIFVVEAGWCRETAEHGPAPYACLLQTGQLL